MVSGDKYIFKDAGGVRIRIFVKEDGPWWYNTDKERDRKNYCHPCINFPTYIRMESDGNILKFIDWDNGSYVYEYVLSETKFGMRVPLTEKQIYDYSRETP